MVSTMYLLCLLITVCVPFSAAQTDDEFKLPSYVDVCYRDDPKVADCLKKDIEKLIPKFKSGSEDFNLASLDPMEFKNLVFDYKSPIIGGYLELPIISVEGLAHLKVTSIKPKLKNPNKFLLDFVGHIPVINLKGAYNLTGNVISLPVRMNGLIDFVLENVDLAYHIHGDVKTIGDNDYLDLRTFSFRFKGDGIKSAYVAGDQIVEGRPALNRAVITALNNNWRILKDNIAPVVFPVTDQLMKGLFKDFFKKYPYDVLFPRRTRVALQSNLTQPIS